GGCAAELAPGALGDRGATRCPDEPAIAALQRSAVGFDDGARARLTADSRQILGRGQVDVPRTERVIQRIDADGAHLDENLALLELRARQLDQPAFAVVAVGSVLDGLHRTARCLVAADRAGRRYMPLQTQVVADKSGNYPFIGEKLWIALMP